METMNTHQKRLILSYAESIYTFSKGTVIFFNFQILIYQHCKPSQIGLSQTALPFLQAYYKIHFSKQFGGQCPPN